MPICHLRLRARKPRPKGYPTVLRTLGDHLRARRMDLGVTQPEVAARLGVTRESVDNWEHDVHPPKAKHVRVIHDFLGYCPVGPDASKLGTQLLAWRRTTGLTQREVAAQIGCDGTTLRDLERGRTQFLHRRTRAAIEHALREGADAPTSATGPRVRGRA